MAVSARSASCVLIASRVAGMLRYLRGRRFYVMDVLFKGVGDLGTVLLAFASDARMVSRTASGASQVALGRVRRCPFVQALLGRSFRIVCRLLHLTR